jgi:hypothetical protein
MQRGQLNGLGSCVGACLLPLRREQFLAGRQDQVEKASERAGSQPLDEEGEEDTLASVDLAPYGGQTGCPGDVQVDCSSLPVFAMLLIALKRTSRDAGVAGESSSGTKGVWRRCVHAGWS